jgi:adenylosuccinate synthase
MSISVVLDLGFGDSGKGRMVDYLANNYDIVARFNGGANSGHQIVNNGKIYTLHLIPSGIFYGKKCVIGNGVVIDPVALKQEIEMLEKDSIDVKSNLYISSHAHIITPEHIVEDKEKEKILNIVTTGRGIGPCYKSKVERSGIRVCDINIDFIERYEPVVNHTVPEKFLLIDAAFQEALKYLLTLNIADVEYLLNDPYVEILAEGAQGTLLDVDFGTYPFVSSSNSSIGGVLTGLGVPPQRINKVYGVFKAYMTRVGNGPFVTETNGSAGKKIREIGNEFGATTGRPRRCGWLDIPALKYACMINGVTDLVMTKSDVLNDFDEVKACIGYSYFDNDYQEELSFYRYDNKLYTDKTKPIYKKFKGWNTIDNKEPLEEYIQYIESEVGVKITLVSIGKDRDDIYERY